MKKAKNEVVISFKSKSYEGLLLQRSKLTDSIYIRLANTVTVIRYA